MSEYKTVSKVSSSGKAALSLDDVFKEYLTSIQEVVKKASMTLPNVSFVFYEDGKDPEEAIYFVSPSMSKIIGGDFAGSLSEMVRDYPVKKYHLKFLLAVFPGITFNGDFGSDDSTEFRIYGGMGFLDKDIRVTVEPNDLLDKSENLVQREAIKVLLTSLRNEYIIQMSMLAPQTA